MTPTTALALSFLAASAALAQTPAFEVAVIKPASMEQLMATVRAGGNPHTGITVDKSRVDIGFQTLSQLISFAYQVVPAQIAGPDFLKDQRFDILAKMPDGATEEQAPQMVQALLAERFKMTMHKDKKEAPIYALVVSKGGLKGMKPATAEEQTPEPQPGDRTQNTPFGKMTIRQTDKNGMVGFMPGLGTLKESAGPNGIRIEMSNLTMARFAQLIMSGSDRVVIDKTGLTGSYQAAFDIAIDAPPPPPAPGAESPGSVATASTPNANPMFQAVELLGLKLESQKDPVEMIVIDHVEKTPTEN